MTTATGGNGEQSLWVALTELKGSMEKGFAEVSGRLDLIAANQDRTAKDVEDLDSRVAALEARRVPWALMSSMATVGGTLGAAIGLLAK